MTQTTRNINDASILLQQQEEAGGVFNADTMPDVVKGWNDRRQANNQIISGMTPFVQLIGIFDQNAYDQMFSSDASLSRRVVYHPDLEGEAATLFSSPDANATSNEDLTDYLESKLKKRFINLYMYQPQKDKDNDTLMLGETPANGIIMAEAISQTKDFTGGIGVTDLSVDYGKSNGLGARKFVMRLTINDPKILNDRPEYAKMSTLQGEFLILYGWSNPRTVHGFDASAPPQLRIDPQGDTYQDDNGREVRRQMMGVPIGNIDTGGYWAAARVVIVGYDFAFNEMGQLEVSLTLMDKTSMYLSTTKMSTVAPMWRKLMHTYDYEPGSNQNSVANTFTNTAVTTPDGQSMTMVEAALQEQASLRGAMGRISGNAISQIALATLDLEAGHSLSEVLDAMNVETVSYNEQSYIATQRAIKQRKIADSRGYPYSAGISSYQKVNIRVPANQADGLITSQDDLDAYDDPNSTLNTKEISDYRVKVMYYYLGWVLDGIKLSLNESNKNRIRMGDTSFSPKFLYLNNSPDSNIASAFQSQVANRNNPAIESRIQEALRRLKEKMFPPMVAISEGGSTTVRYRTKPTNKPMTGELLDTVDLVDETHTPCLGQALYIGVVSPDTESLATRTYPTPQGVAVELPHRGSIVRNDGSSFFKPDWYVDTIDGEGNEHASPEGFDPTNPTAYKAADRGGRFFYLIKYRWSASWQEQVKDDRTGNLNWETIYGTIYTQDVMEVDVFRKFGATLWPLVQRMWYNRYIDYLGAYFENIIRRRIAELEEEGRTVEDIYDEPVDLDFLTGKVYNNTRFMKKQPSGGTRWSDPGFDSGDAKKIDQDLLDTISTEENTIAPLNQQKVDIESAQRPLEMEIRSKIAAITNLQSIEGTTILDNPNAGIEQLTGGRYSRTINVDTDGNQIAPNMISPYIGAEDTDIFHNAITRSDYGYGGSAVNKDAMGNFIYDGFNNFKENIRGNALEFRSGTFYETGVRLDNTTENQTPKVTIEYVGYIFFGKRTDNFKGSDDDEGNEHSKFFTDPDNVGMLIALEKQLIDVQRTVDQKLAQIERLRKELEPLYQQYEDYNAALLLIDEKINITQGRLSQYRSFVDEGGVETELSLYTDTSVFDDVLEIDMGREHPMRLNSKVAQQWYRRFNNIINYGVNDVTNYGPAKGGTTYHAPSNVKQFLFNPNLKDSEIDGMPKVVLDPKAYMDLRTAGESHDSIMGNLESGVSQGVDYIPLNIINDRLNDGTYVTVDNLSYYKQWGIFGTPQNVSERTNLWGFKAGPMAILYNEDGTIYEVGGGNYVRNYQEFLDIFNIVYNPILLGKFKITGAWPRKPNSLEPWYMIDDANNIIESRPSDGWFRQTGWYLGDAGQPIYLYPSRAYATRIDPTKTTAALPYGTPDGVVGLPSDGPLDDNEHTDRGDRNHIDSKLNKGDHWLKSEQEWDGANFDPTVRANRPVDPLGRNSKPDQSADEDQWAQSTYGPRIGPNEHCMQLTIDMKRKLVINRKNFFDQANDDKNQYYNSLGKDSPVMSGDEGGSSRGQTRVDWSQLVKLPELTADGVGFPFWVVKTDPYAGTTRSENFVYAAEGSSVASINGYDIGGNITTKDGQQAQSITPKRGSSVQGPRVNKTAPYSNQYYPYGTGHYRLAPEIYGSARFPEYDGGNYINFLPIGELLELLPGTGYLTNVNNENYSPSGILPNGDIIEGHELDVGFMEFILKNVYAPLPNNRRIGKTGDGKRVAVHQKAWYEGWGDAEDQRISDPTYRDLFKIEEDDDDDEGSEADLTMADLSSFTIDNAADIPIRRDVIENLMNKQNANMSILQFIQEVIRPEAIGVNGQNVNVGVRQRGDGTFEVFQASKNWKETARKMFDNFDQAQFENKYPSENLLFDYKAKDSLIEKIDMNSKFDPGIATTFEMGARAFAKDPYKFAQFLSYGNIALELQDFLNKEGDQYKDIITVSGENVGGEAGKVQYNSTAFFNSDADGPTVPSNLITKFLMQNPERMAKLNAMLQSGPGSNFATQLLARYMFKASITIHGTTNIIPFNTIHVRGVLPNLEGIYLVTNTRESISPSGFSTTLEAILLETKAVNTTTGDVID